MNKNYMNETEPLETNEDIVCPGCGSNKISSAKESYTFTYGTGANAVELTAEVPVRNCEDCKFSFLDSVAEDICHEVVCKHLGVMTPSEIKDLRGKYNLSQSQFAEITKLGEATLSRWERGTIIQNQAYDNYLYLLRLPLNLERIRNRSKLEENITVEQKEISIPRFRQLDPNDEEIANRSKTFKLRPSLSCERPVKCM